MIFLHSIAQGFKPVRIIYRGSTSGQTQRPHRPHYTRFDIRLTTEISKINEHLTEEIGKVNERVTKEIGKVHVNIAHVERKIIRWMFIFWIGQIGAIIMGLLSAFFK